MALGTLTFDFNALFFPQGLNFIAAFEGSPFGIFDPLDRTGQFSSPQSLSAAKKALGEDDEFEEDDDEEEEEEDDDDEFEEDDDDEDEDEDEGEYEEEDDDDEEDGEDEDVDELQVGRRR